MNFKNIFFSCLFFLYSCTNLPIENKEPPQIITKKDIEIKLKKLNRQLFKITKEDITNVIKIVKYVINNKKM